MGTETESESGTETVHIAENLDELSIEEAVEIVQDITSTLEEGDVSLDEAQRLREKADRIIDHVEEELEVSDGETKRVQP